MIRKALASALLAHLKFIQRHPVLNAAVSLVLIAACFGAIYLILVKYQAVLKMSCFTLGSCGR